jgi:hypothetical protein
LHFLAAFGSILTYWEGVMPARTGSIVTVAAAQSVGVADGSGGTKLRKHDIRPKPEVDAR